MEQYYKETIQT